MSSLQEESIEWTVNLQIHPEQQTKLDEWKEYYLFECWRRRSWEKKLDRFLQKPEAERGVSNYKLINCHLICQGPRLETVKQQLLEVAAECAVSSQLSEIHPSSTTRPSGVQETEPSPHQPGLRCSKSKSSVLAPIHSSKVSKVSQSGKRSLDQKRGIIHSARKEVLSSTFHALDEERLQVQSLPKANIRRSERISKRKRSSSTPSSGPAVAPADRSSQRLASEPAPMRRAPSREYHSEPPTAAKSNHHPGPTSTEEDSRKRTRRGCAQQEGVAANIHFNSLGVSRTEGKPLPSTRREALLGKSLSTHNQIRPSANSPLGPVHASKITKSARKEKPLSSTRIAQVSKGMSLSGANT